MKPARFEYHRPETVDQVLVCLAELDDAKLLAGGQSLMAMMNFRFVTPAHLVDLNRVTELTGIELDAPAGELRIGAMTRQRDILDSPLVREHVPVLGEALRWVGHPATRNRGTIGGSLAHLDPAAELPGVLLACDAVIEVRGLAGIRQVAMREWSLGYMTPSLEPHELLQRIRVPVRRAGHGYAFHELARRHGDFALAGAAAVLELEDGLIRSPAVALIGVDDTPLRLTSAEELLLGQAPSAGLVERAAAMAHEVPGIDDVHASADYRRRIAATMVQRALRDALARARHRVT